MNPKEQNNNLAFQNLNKLDKNMKKEMILMKTLKKWTEHILSIKINLSF